MSDTMPFNIEEASENHLDREEFTYFLSDLTYEYSTEPLRTPPSLPGACQQSSDQSLGESEHEMREGFLNSSLSEQHTSVGGLFDTLFEESLASPQTLHTSLPNFHDLYQHLAERPISHTVAPTDILAVEPFQQLMPGSPHPESPCEGSPNSTDVFNCPFIYTDGIWRCAYPGCKSQKAFNRRCDFDRHYKYHIKTLSCRYSDCPQAAKASFATPKERDRHEAKHNPNITCEWKGCQRLFSSWITCMIMWRESIGTKQSKSQIRVANGKDVQGYSANRKI